MNSIPKITLDNNCIINLFDQSAQTPTSVESLQELIKLSFSNKLEIAITTRVESDLENDTQEVRKGEMMRTIRLFPVVGTVARLDVSRWDSGDVYGGTESSRIFDELQKIIFPGGLNKASNTYTNKVNDLDHLVGHYINKRDIFVTDDSDILKKQTILKITPGIMVMSPKDCLLYIQEIEDRKVKKLFEVPVSKKYHSTALKGKVTFDYSNNNGRYTIGDGYYLFETHWSSASADSIHAYSGSDSVATIALAKGISEIDQIQNGEAFDSTSHSRSPDEGQIIILKNKNNIFAAIKVIDVKYDGRGDDVYELTFEYFIQPNGTADFSK